MLKISPSEIKGKMLQGYSKNNKIAKNNKLTFLLLIFLLQFLDNENE
jgi:hypothetical protein